MMEAVLKRCEYCNLLYWDNREDHEHPERWKCGGACDDGREKLITDVLDDECNGYDKSFTELSSWDLEDLYEED